LQRCERFAGSRRRPANGKWRRAGRGERRRDWAEPAPVVRILEVSGFCVVVGFDDSRFFAIFRTRPGLCGPHDPSGGWGVDEIAGIGLGRGDSAWGFFLRDHPAFERRRRFERASIHGDVVLVLGREAVCCARRASTSGTTRRQASCRWNAQTRNLRRPPWAIADSSGTR